jgi:hypothetical protein
VLKIVLCAALLFPIVSSAHETCEEKAVKISRTQSRPVVELDSAAAVANEEELLNFCMECMLWDFETNPKLRALLPPQRPTVVGKMTGGLRSPYLEKDKIVFPFEYYGYLNLIGLLVGHDAYANDYHFPLEKTLLNTPYRMGEVTSLMNPLSAYLDPSSFSSLQQVLMCGNNEQDCQNVLKSSLAAIVLFPLLHELSHLALHHAVGIEGVNANDEIAADKRAFKALRIISETVFDKNADTQKECRFTYVLAPLVWLQSEASRTPGSNSLAEQRLQALLGELDEEARETVESIINPETSKHNLQKLSLSWDRTPERLYIDGIRVSPADVLGKRLILASQPHVIVALSGESLAVAQVDSSSQTRSVTLALQPFKNSSLSEVESLQSVRKSIDILLRTTDVNLQPRNSSLAIYHWRALHMLHLDSLIQNIDWTEIPPAKRAEVQMWQQSGQFLSCWWGRPFC